MLKARCTKSVAPSDDVGARHGAELFCLDDTGEAQPMHR